MDHIAHIKNTGGLDNESVTEETVSEHCKKTALLARSYSAPFNMESTVFVSALLHDSGKLNNCYLTSRIRIFDTQNTKSE